jgi:hypothetical protein
MNTIVFTFVLVAICNLVSGTSIIESGDDTAMIYAIVGLNSSESIDNSLYKCDNLTNCIDDIITTLTKSEYALVQYSRSANSCYPRFVDIDAFNGFFVYGVISASGKMIPSNFPYSCYSAQECLNQICDLANNKYNYGVIVQSRC